MYWESSKLREKSCAPQPANQLQAHWRKSSYEAYAVSHLLPQSFAEVIGERTNSINKKSLHP
jgi:hypothetical protein